MAQLSCEVGRAPKQATPGKDRSADAGTESYEQDLAESHGCSVAALCSAGTGRVVVDIDLYCLAQALLQHAAHRDTVGSVEVGREPNHAGDVDEAGDADAGRHRKELAEPILLVAKSSSFKRGEQVAAQLLQRVDDCLAAIQRAESPLHEHAPIAVDDDTKNLGPSDVDADSGGRCQVPPSTFAFRSRIAACRMLPSARRFMKPGSGTLSSTTRL